MTEKNKNAVHCPYCGAHHEDYDPFAGDYFSTDFESAECGSCKKWFSYGARELKRFEPQQCSQYDKEKKQCKWEIDEVDYYENDDYECDHKSGCCPTSSDFSAWIDDYEIVVQKEDDN